MVRKGLSTLVGAGLLILFITVAIGIYSFYIESIQYEIKEQGLSSEEKIIRVSEKLRLYYNDSSIMIENIGDVSVNLTNLLIEDGSGISIEDINVYLRPGDTYVIPKPSNSGNLYAVSSRGRIFNIRPLNSSTQLSGGFNDGDGLGEIFIQVNSSTGVIKLDGYMLSGQVTFERYERDILYISSSNGYVAVDLIKNKPIYEGLIKIFSSRDGKVIVSAGFVYVNGRLINGITVNYIRYIGYNYMVVGFLSNINYIVVSDGTVIDISGSYFTYNGNYSFLVRYLGTESGYHKYQVNVLDSMNYSVLGVYTLYSDVKGCLHIFEYPQEDICMGFRDNGGVPTGVREMSNINSLPVTYVSRLTLDGGNKLKPYFEGIYRSINSLGQRVENIAFLDNESTVSTGFPMTFSLGSKIGVDRSTYSLNGSSRISILGSVRSNADDIDGSYFSIKLLNGDSGVEFRVTLYPDVYTGNPYYLVDVIKLNGGSSSLVYHRNVSKNPHFKFSLHAYIGGNSRIYYKFIYGPSDKDYDYISLGSLPSRLIRLIIENSTVNHGSAGLNIFFFSVGDDGYLYDRDMLNNIIDSLGIASPLSNINPFLGWSHMILLVRGHVYYAGVDLAVVNSLPQKSVWFSLDVVKLSAKKEPISSELYGLYLYSASTKIVILNETVFHDYIFMPYKDLYVTVHRTPGRFIIDINPLPG